MKEFSGHTSENTAGGQLDGLTIFRFALVRKDLGGGIEEHLANVNRLLLERNQMTIVQTFLHYTEEKQSECIKYIGRGRLIWVPLKHLNMPRSWRPDDIFTLLCFCSDLSKSKFWKFIFSAIGSAVGLLPLSKKIWFRFFCQTPGEEFCRLFQLHRFDLAIFHSLVSLDDMDIICKLIRVNVPFAAIQHFENSRLSHPMLRLKLMKAKAVGVVSSIGVPDYLQPRTIEIREGIDTEFFQNARATPIKNFNNENMIFLPARISRSKGQLDLLQALSLLNRDGINVKLAIAGRTDDEKVMRELTSAISHLSDPKQVIILGNLDQATLRNWYSTCSLVAMPSYSEGLGRTLLEAQAMQRPVIAYDSGGVPSAMLDGETGFLVKKGDINGLASRISELLSSESLLLKMGEAGRRFVETRFGLAQLVESHEKLYLTALEKSL